MGEATQGVVDAPVTISDVATRVQHHRRRVLDEVRVGITAQVPSLSDDEAVQGLLNASIEENVDTLLHMLQNAIPVERVEAPSAALEYARRLAQRDIALTDLVRAYRLGQARFLHTVLGELADLTAGGAAEGEATLQIVESTSAYIDKVSVAVVTAYQEERERWLAHRNATRSNLARRLLAGEPVGLDTAELELRYRLRGRHLGVVAWIGDRSVTGEQLLAVEALLGRIGDKMAVSEPPLVIPCDRTTWWCWLPLPGDALDPVAELTEAVRANPDCGEVCLAVGEPAAGADGFVRSHRQAVAARCVALAATPGGPAVTPFKEVGPLALMASDLELTRAWVLDTLGPLAGRPHARLRETVRVFLATSCSFTKTATRLMLHRNSVQYRLRRAAEVRGRGWEDDRLAMELALHACHWFGDRVLADT
jgi:hypothetical protein